jgi:molecular chaperone GrpE
MEAEKEAHPALFDGVALIKNKLNDTLRAKGLLAMEPSTGQVFDVETMEAITRIPAPEEGLKGKVIDEVERGYKLGNKIIRYARVVVGE